MHRVASQWYSFNDSSCNEVDDYDHIVSPAAYVMMFMRRGADTAQYLPSFGDDREGVEVGSDDESVSGDGSEDGDKCIIL